MLLISCYYSYCYIVHNVWCHTLGGFITTFYVSIIPFRRSPAPLVCSVFFFFDYIFELPFGMSSFISQLSSFICLRFFKRRGIRTPSNKARTYVFYSFSFNFIDFLDSTLSPTWFTVSCISEYYTSIEVDWSVSWSRF